MKGNATAGLLKYSAQRASMLPEDSSTHRASMARVRIQSDADWPEASASMTSMTHTHDSDQANGNGNSAKHGPEEEEEEVVDWQIVLTSLQREKKRAIARKEEQYVNRSLFCLESSSSIRELCIKVVEMPVFSGTVLILIAVNCIFLALDEPLCKNTGAYEKETQNDLYQRMLYQQLDCSWWPAMSKALDASEIFFTVAFTLEMVLKIVARGFVLHKHAYLRDSWNCLDALVVVASLLGASQLFSQGDVFKTVRVFRPLRAMTRIKGMQPLMSTIGRSVNRLKDVPPHPPTCQPTYRPTFRLPTHPPTYLAASLPSNLPTNQAFQQATSDSQLTSQLQKPPLRLRAQLATFQRETGEIEGVCV